MNTSNSNPMNDFDSNSMNNSDTNFRNILDTIDPALTRYACSDVNPIIPRLDKSDINILDTINPALTRYARNDVAPVLPLRDEPDLLTWLEASGRLVADEATNSPDISTVEEEELSALMGEKEDYNSIDEQNEEGWES